MSDFHLESLEQCFNTLKTDMTLAEFADLAESAALSASQIAAVSFVFEHLRKKKIEPLFDETALFPCFATP